MLSVLERPHFAPDQDLLLGEQPLLVCGELHGALGRWTHGAWVFGWWFGQIFSPRKCGSYATATNTRGRRGGVGGDGRKERLDSYPLLHF